MVRHLRLASKPRAGQRPRGHDGAGSLSLCFGFGLLLQLSLTSSELALASGSAATGSPLGQRTSIMVPILGVAVPVAMAVSAI